MSKKVNGATKSPETIPMDVIVLNILVFVHPFLFFEPEYRSHLGIKDYYGYFRRDRTRKIYFLYRSFHIIEQFRDYRHVFNIEKAIDLSLVVPLEDELAQKFFANSHRTRSLRTLILGIRRHNLELLSRAFSKEGCYPNLDDFRICSFVPDFFSPVKFPSRLRKQLPKFGFVLDVPSSDYTQIRFEFPLILDNPSLDNLKMLRLEHVIPKQRLVLKTPKLRILVLKHCDNISLETGKELEVVEPHGMKAEFIKKLCPSLNPSNLRRLTIDTGGLRDDRDYTFLFDGQEGRTPLKKFRRLERISLAGVEWNNEVLGDNERIFPNESLEFIEIASCKSLKRHHANWSSEKLEKIHQLSVPLCLDPKVDLKNLKILMLRKIEGLTDDFFREAKFGKLETISTEGLSFLSGVGWDESFRRKLKFLSLWNVDVNTVLSSGDFLSLETIIFSRKHTKATKWRNLPSLRKITCKEEFYESLKECNTEGNIDFGRLKWESW